LRRKAVGKTKRRSVSFEYGRMLKLLFWIAYVVALGLCHIHLRLATRDMEIQRRKLQAEWDQLWNERNSLASEVAALSDGDRMLEYARNELHLVALPAERITVWAMPKDLVERYDRAYTEIALSRESERERSRKEPLLARLLGTVLAPEAQARSESPVR